MNGVEKHGTRRRQNMTGPLVCRARRREAGRRSGGGHGGGPYLEAAGLEDLASSRFLEAAAAAVALGSGPDLFWREASGAAGLVGRATARGHEGLVSQGRQ